VKYASSVDAIERHLGAHEPKEVTKHCKLKGTENRFRCAGQNFSGGKCFPGQAASLRGFIIDGVKYNEGDGWGRKRCGGKIKWGAEHNGKKVRRIIEKIEQRLIHIRIRGCCAEEEQRVGGNI
jgi:hypothetical protein